MASIKFMVIGSGAREHAIAACLKKEGNEIISFQIRPNIGLQRLCSSNFVSASYDAQSIVNVAKDNGVRVIVPGTEEAIFNGITNLAEKELIYCYGPSLEASVLEADKFFAKRIVASIDPSLTIPYIHATNVDEARGFINVHGLPVVLKSLRSSSQKGVKVVTELDKFEEYTRQYLDDSGSALLEKYIEGNDFSIYCFVDINHLYFSKMVKDYPFKLEGNKGDKTGGMGSISMHQLLPYVTDTDYDTACDCILRTLEHLKRAMGIIYKGILGAQFIKSRNGIFFVEYDVRPGDPEIINVLESLETDFTSIIMTTMEGSLEAPRTNNSCVVCIYHVPHGYPNLALPDFYYLTEDILESESIFFGDVRREKKGLVTGRGRSLVVVGKDEMFEEAKRIAFNNSINLNTGLFYRSDIGDLDLAPF